MRERGIYNIRRALPRMSWSPVNLYNLWQRSEGPLHSEITGMTTAYSTLYQNRWLSKKLVRAYHGDFIPEKKYKRWYMLETLPNVRPKTESGDDADALQRFARRQQIRETYRAEEEKEGLAPVGSLMFSPVERRIDVFIFRCCFAHSVYEARRLVVHGHVMLNGRKHDNCNTRLAPGDMVSVDPEAIRFFKEKQTEAVTDVRALLLRWSQEEAVPETKDEEAQDLEEDTPKRKKDTRTRQLASEIAPHPERPVDFLDLPKEPSPYDALQLPLDSQVKLPLDGPEEAAVEAKTDSSTAEDVTDTAPAEATEEPEAENDADVLDEADKPPPPSDAVIGGFTRFYLPQYAIPWIFIPAYIEVSFPTCSAVYVRHPTARPGYSEIPTPYAADGDVIRFAWEWYAKRKTRLRSTAQLRRMPEDRAFNPEPVMLEKARTLLRKKRERRREAMSGVIL